MKCVGQRFTLIEKGLKPEKYILACSGFDRSSKRVYVCLINLQSGNRWGDAILTNHLKITEEEFSVIKNGGNFTTKGEVI